MQHGKWCKKSQVKNIWPMGKEFETTTIDKLGTHLHLTYCLFFTVTSVHRWCLWHKWFHSIFYNWCFQITVYLFHVVCNWLISLTYCCLCDSVSWVTAIQTATSTFVSGVGWRNSISNGLLFDLASVVGVTLEYFR